MKNCGRRFHVQVAHKDFLGELIKIIGPKNDPPQAVQEKILSLIQVCYLLKSEIILVDPGVGYCQCISSFSINTASMDLKCSLAHFPKNILYARIFYANICIQVPPNFNV